MECREQVARDWTLPQASVVRKHRSVREDLQRKRGAGIHPLRLVPLVAGDGDRKGLEFQVLVAVVLLRLFKAFKDPINGAVDCCVDCCVIVEHCDKQVGWLLLSALQLAMV
jgi:hypothetical protein